MIGIICNESEKEITREFFELFKTPWEFCMEGREYDVVISTLYEFPKVDGRLTVIYSSEQLQIDSLKEITVERAVSKHIAGHAGIGIPIYGKLVCFHGQGYPVIYGETDSEVVALGFSEPPEKILRVGYNLFDEITFLLSEGQPVENALIPTLEAHIALLRDWIVDAGIPVVEIPPVPWGHKFIACLTHDVDFAGIRHHKFDHTMWGFVYRALVGSLVEFARDRSSWDRVVKNWSAALSLPLIYIGALKDFWDQFDNYAEIEKDLSSTFFMLPYKDKAGDKAEGQFPIRRAGRYDINEVIPQLNSLVQWGFEIGLHGIDAWHSAEKGKLELERITETTGQKEVGVRMHWLCFDHDSPLALEQAGFNYDSTFGYNVTIGFKGGTTQVFQPLRANHLLELPLNIQDTALFFPGRMALNDHQAWDLCQSILDSVALFGGVVTILWHMRSLAPERLWGDFYTRLLQELRDRGAWFGTANQVVQWFRRRRSTVFEDSRFVGNTLRMKLQCKECELDSPLILRVRHPRKDRSRKSQVDKSYVDIPWSGESSVEIPLA